MSDYNEDRAYEMGFVPEDEDQPLCHKVYEQEERLNTPYPWCYGNPTKADCARDGYCRRDPNCGE